MFDTFIAPRRTEYVTRRVDVTENRAPTDDSVKLLREMEQAADAKRIASMQMSGNLFNGVVEIYETPHDDMIHARSVFDINGHRMTATASEHSTIERAALLASLHEKVANKIASEILIDMTRGMIARKAF